MASACTAASTTATVVFIDDVTADQKTRMKSQVSPQIQLNAVNLIRQCFNQIKKHAFQLLKTKLKAQK